MSSCSERGGRRGRRTRGRGAATRGIAGSRWGRRSARAAFGVGKVSVERVSGGRSVCGEDHTLGAVACLATVHPDWRGLRESEQDGKFHVCGRTE
jgi:hypothetical protein